MTSYFKFIAMAALIGLGSFKISSIDAASKSVSPILFDFSTTNPGDSSTTIKFNEFTVHLTRLFNFDNDTHLNQIPGDSCYIIADVGESIVGGRLSVSSNLLTDLKVEQCYETSVSISNEGPHCDLKDWKHFYSDWQALQRVNATTFQCFSYTDKEEENFPEINIKELKRKVKDQCGKEWYKLVKNIKSPTENPSWVGISRIYFRVTGKLNGKTVTKIIIVEEAMGC